MNSKMTRVLKYELQPKRRQILYMPIDAKPLTVAEQNERLVMWAQVPQAGVGIPRIFVVVTTGDIFESVGKRYIGSAQLGEHGWYAAHVYEQLESIPDPIDGSHTADLI